MIWKILTMSKFFIIFFLVFGPTLFAATTEPPRGTYNSYRTHFKFFKKFDEKKTISSQIEMGSFYNNKRMFKVDLHGLFKVHQNHKLGLGASKEYGNRHTDDWVNKNNEWQWQDTSKRSESVLSLQHLYTKRLGAHPIIFNFRTTFDKNLFNQQERITLKPGLNYFLFGASGPRYSFHYFAPQYYTLNFEKNKIYKSGHYLGFLFHESKKLQYGLNYQQRIERWTNSKEFNDKRPSDKYDIEDTINILKAEVIFNY